MLNQYLNQCLNPYVLLISSVLFIVVSITDNSQIAEVLAIFLITIIMLLLAFRIARSGHRLFSVSTFIAILVLIAISILCYVLPYLADWPIGIKTLFFISSALIRFYIFGMGWLLLVRTLAIKQKVTEHTIVTAIVCYLFIGIIWSLIYYPIWQIDPNAFHIAHDRDYEFKPWNLVLYFSFTTLTTVGFGDIIPGTRWIMTLAVFEAMTGAIYLTVVVARLVALFSAPDA